MLRRRSTRVVASVLVVSLALLGAACSDTGTDTGSSGSTKGGGAKVYTQRDDDITVANGNTFTVALPITSGTGYTWEAQSNPDLQQMGTQTVHGADRAGAPATQRITFRAQATGGGTQRTTLELDYVRPWEDGVPPAQTASFAVKITS
jgi:inhibitor of cysteine peptidase